MYPQQSYQPPPPKKRRNPTWLVVTFTIIMALCVMGGIIALVAALAGGGDNGNPPGSNGGQVGAGPVGLNQPARDGKFEFTVTKVECGEATAGSELLNKKAQGQFCFVTMKVENISTEAQTFDASNQTAYGEGGVKYGADGEATIYLDDANSFLVDINPGNAVTGVVAFDIPKGAAIERLELHDSAFSGGVTVTL